MSRAEARQAVHARRLVHPTHRATKQHAKLKAVQKRFLFTKRRRLGEGAAGTTEDRTT